MPFQKKRSPLTLRADELNVLQAIGTSRTESYSTAKRARILLGYAQGESISSIARTK